MSCAISSSLARCMGLLCSSPPTPVGAVLDLRGLADALSVSSVEAESP